MKLNRRLLSVLATAGSLLASQLAFAKPEAGSSRSATLDGARIHYTDYGSGKFALVLVHGWICDESVWKEQATALAKTARVITLDLPGHGQSDKPQMAYTMDLHARAIDAVMQAAGIETAVLIGHSNGTPVVRQFYRLYPAKVSGLVIVDGSLRPFGDAAMMSKFIDPLRGPDYPRVTSRFIDGMTAPMKEAREHDRIKKMMLATPQYVAVSEMEALLDPKIWEENKIDVPVLVILAKQPAWTPEYETFVRKLVPNVDYRTWDGVSHFLMIDRPREFNDAVREFLAKNNLPPR